MNDIIQWLLEDDNPSVRLRTFRELMNCDDNTPEVRQAKSAAMESQPVKNLLAKIHPDGYWLQKNPRTQEVLGEGVVYGSFGTTHFCLAYLAELGLDRTHPQVEKAAERYLDLQQPDGDWYRHFSCLLGYNIRTFVLLGYRNDPRLKRAVELLADTQRWDGGYLCDMHEGKRKTMKSCIRGSVKALLAFSELPDYWDHSRCKGLVDYFLRRGGIFQSAHPNIPVNQDMQNMSFPITWRANSWEVLYALSKMGYGDDERLQAAWTNLESRADTSGRFSLDWTSTQSPWKVGKRGEVNKWITFYVEAAKRYRAGKGKQ
ncbi:MAG TPA: hypothetical protein VHP14_09690 [Anaerolineales bacterium]|nr:hypothetical protein [Anaerolineales bacterium]